MTDPHTDTDTDDVTPAEMRPRMAALTETLRQHHEQAPDAPLGRIYEHWMHLWENPAAFEQGNLTEPWKDDAVLLFFEMGVTFGIDYEQAYPEGRNADWPVPVAERPESTRDHTPGGDAP